MSTCCGVQSCSSGPTHRFISAQAGEAAYLSAHVRGGECYLQTVCWSSQRRSQGARQDLGKRILGADFLMSQLGRGMKVGLFEAELIGV